MPIATKLLSFNVSFEEFLRFDDNNELNEYELADGRLVLMPEPDEWHEAIAAFLDIELNLLFRKLNLRLTTRKRCALEVSSGWGRRPDLAVIDRPQFFLDDHPTMGIRSHPRMLIEVASNNWSNDLVDKQEEYQALGVAEYWIVDYRGQIPAKYCSRGKGRKVIVLLLNEQGEYDRTEFLPGEVITCRSFPGLVLSVDQIILAGET